MLSEPGCVDGWGGWGVGVGGVGAGIGVGGVGVGVARFGRPTTTAVSSSATALPRKSVVRFMAVGLNA
jgi:hypothetical protein